MKREFVMDKTMNRLIDHFGSCLVTRPPASKTEIAELEVLVGQLPRDFRYRLSTCDGLRVVVDDPKIDTHLWHVHEIYDAIMRDDKPAIPAGLVPIHGTLPGDCDWLIVEEGPLYGAVVRWDPWAEGVEIVASDIKHYFAAWTQYLIDHFDSAGHARSEDRPAFDTSYIAAFDAEIFELSTKSDVKDWLTRLEHAAASGDDFE